MNKILLLLILIFSTLTHAQKSNYDFKAADLKARKLIYSKPDSALVVIKKTLQQKGMHDTIFGNSYNLYGTYYGMKGLPDSSIYYFKKALTYLDDSPKNKARLLLNLSIAYRNKGENRKSIDILHNAIDINKKIKYETGIGMAYGELASNYNILNEYDKSVEYLQKSIAILKNDKNSAKLLPAVKQKLANTYLKMNNFKFAADLYLECLAGFKVLGTEKNYYMTLLNLGEAYIHLNRLSDAAAALKEANVGLEKFGDKEMIGINFSKIGNVEYLQRRHASAVSNYDKALKYLLASDSQHIVRIGSEYINLLNKGKDYKRSQEIMAIVEKTKKLKNATKADRLEYERATGDVYSATNDDKKAIESYKATIATMDSINKTDREQAIQEMQAQFQTELQREKNIVLEERNKVLEDNAGTEKKLMLLYIIASIAIIVMILMSLRGSWLKNKLQNEKLKLVETEKNLIQQQHVHDQQLNNSQKEVIEEKQRELTSLALRMANYQDNLSEIVEKCDNGQYTKIADVKHDLNQLAKNKDYWKQFETRFNHLHPDFNATLSNRFAKLTKNDLEFCSLLKLNLSNKEIASLLQISHESAITKKYRIKKKMEIIDDAEFEKLLMEI